MTKSANRRPNRTCAEALWLGGLTAASAAVAFGAGTFAAAPATVAGGAGDPPKTRAEAAVAAPGRSVSTVRYGKDIRRILSDRCFQCHGPDAATRHADLRLDERESAIKPRDGSTPIVPGDAAGSELWRRIASDDAAIKMPPPDSNKKPLTAEEKELIGAWIDDGAVYEAHWSFEAPKKAGVPQVKDGGWCGNDIDRFVLANLESHGVQPSERADKETLLRRVTLDLTGLPPTPEEIDAFLADESPDAYERVVDRLFTQEPYKSRLAERLTAPWLDAARFADTCGIHMDGGRQIWPWRDWVLTAFRDNMPYDRFLTEQLAGDLLPDATLAQKVASGFNRNHVTTDEGGAIAEEYLVEYAVDRVSTTSAVFLGLTAGCARCHDHKFDPISQEDFYGLFAFFNSIDEPGLYSQTPDAKRAYEPFIEVPTPEQSRAIEDVKTHLATLAKRMEEPVPGEQEKRESFLRETVSAAHVSWTTPEVVTAQSSDPGTTMTVQADGSVLPSGKTPNVEDYTLTLRSGETGLRFLLVEAMAPEGKGAGRAFNNNAVVSNITLEERAAGAPAWTNVPFRWAWADHSQTDGDYDVSNVIDPDEKLGWAIGAHQKPGSRLLLLATDRSFGIEGGTELRLVLSFRSQYETHSLGQVRVRTAKVSEGAFARLPLSFGRWQLVGPFPADSPQDAFDKAFGPETIPTIDLKHNFGAGNQYWRFDGRLTDERPVNFGEGTNATYIGRHIWAPSAREIKLSLGSDDGFRLYVNGEQIAAKQVDRSLAPNQDEAKIALRAGMNSLVLKIVNTGGPAGYYFRADQAEDILRGDMTEVFLPPDALSREQAEQFAVAWRRTFSPEYRAIEEERAETDKKQKELEAAVPRTMVMKELEKQRETYVLDRGQYDKPIKTRPVKRAIPKSLGAAPAEEPKDRLALARWMTAPENPLVARVAVNRVWEMVFGAGLVRTSEDFGLQGEYPTHPELLDYLAVDFRESGWDVHRLLRSMVLSSTYKQSSKVRADLAEIDADNKWLASYPRRRLGAEQIRDLALFASGLLVEKVGGPSVKPYQPEGLWQEVAMPQSNTREFVRGEKDDLYRRGMYTYWKRASPPPSLLTFDAPTREACVIRRPTTNTPLQALVLMNDEQYLEAARVLAQRTLASKGDDGVRMTMLFRRCAGRAPTGAELTRLVGTLNDFRARYAADIEDAEALLKIGASMREKDMPAPELAAWTVLASAVINLHETVTQD